MGRALLSASGASAETPLERGTYLVQSIAACGNCHTTLGPEGPVPGMEMAGSKDFFDLPGIHINTPNITPDMETGIGSWTDELIMTAIREGRRPDGNQFPGPWGISVSTNITPTGLRTRSDDDIKRIITTGIRPGGAPVLPPMGFANYRHISDSDLDAIMAYLRSLPPK